MRGWSRVAVLWFVVMLSACGRDQPAPPGDPAPPGEPGPPDGGAPPVCGDGRIDPGEQCDDGNPTDGDACDRNCTFPSCGNSRIDPGEQCDDGNDRDGDRCDRNCTRTACGNGILTIGEACDDGNAADGDGCDRDCSFTACGNGIPTAGEACDDGNATEGDECDSNCTVPACGNGVVSLGEGCDDGNAADGDGCDRNCTPTSCGNWIQTEGEACDDGNSVDDDGCDHNCSITACGNGIVTDGEACDDGNLDESDGCRNDCSSDVLAQLSYVKASNTGQGDGFGASVALSADGATLAMGAYHEDSSATGVGGDPLDDGAYDAGAAYVYVRTGVGWALQAYVKGASSGEQDELGAAVALSADGSTLAVSAPGEDSNATGVGGDPHDDSATNAGAVYVYTRDGDTWSMQAYLKASNAGAYDAFGTSLALSADGATLVIGAPFEASDGRSPDDDQQFGAGAVYVFRREGVAWSEQAYLKAEVLDSGDLFGRSVALSSDGATLAIGAYGEDGGSAGHDGDPADDGAPSSGAAYVFTREGATWQQRAYLKASNPGAEDWFGIHVALAGDGSTLAVGAPEEDSAATGINGPQGDNSRGGAGAVYLFARQGDAWTQEAYVKASRARHLGFGWSVALSGDGGALLVGAPHESSSSPGIDGDQDDDSASHAGAAYLFQRVAATWAQQHYIKARNPGSPDQFGSALTLARDVLTLAIGAFWEAGSATGVGGPSDENAYASGAVYVFQ